MNLLDIIFIKSTSRCENLSAYASWGANLRQRHNAVVTRVSHHDLKVTLSKRSSARLSPRLAVLGVKG